MARLQPDDISDSLERGSIVYFPQSPVALPSEEDLKFLREELPALLKLKNISYHPEAGKVRGLDDSDAEISRRVTRILKQVSDDIAAFLSTAAPRLTDNWTVGTSSFRPMQERGRNLDAHASNELVHIDAGADDQSREFEPSGFGNHLRFLDRQVVGPGFEIDDFSRGCMMRCHLSSRTVRLPAQYTCAA